MNFRTSPEFAPPDAENHVNPQSRFELSSSRMRQKWYTLQPTCSLPFMFLLFTELKTLLIFENTASNYMNINE